MILLEKEVCLVWECKSFQTPFWKEAKYAPWEKKHYPFQAKEMTVTEKAGWKQHRFGYVLSPQMQHFINMEDWQCRQTPSMLKDAT